jgi:predicted nucleic-acid-binding protein
LIGIDTNILVRYFVRDDVAQSDKAAKYLEKHCSSEIPGFITSIVLCELIWVLSGAYGYDKELITDLLNKMLTTSEFLIENQEEALRALSAFEKGNADFSDYYLAYIGQKYGVGKTVTFDKRAGKHKLFELI